MMKQLIMSEMADFECIGGECPDTCCAGWRVYIDKETESFYRQVEGEFGDRLRKSICTDESGRCKFEMNQSNRCPFLNEQNLCQVYRTLGPDAMCDTCRDYPRILYSAGDILFAALSISCPEAGRMILSKVEKAQYVFTEDEGSVLGGDTDWDKFNNAIRSYVTIQGILQERCFSVKKRLLAVTVYTNQIQEMKKRGDETTSITQLFQNPKMYSEAIEPIVCSQRAIAEKFKFIRLYVNTTLKIFRNRYLIAELKNIASYLSNMSGDYADEWYDALDKFDTCVPETEQEQLLVYLLFRHFMEKYKDRSIWESTIFILSFFSAYRCIAVLHYLSCGEFPNFERRILMVARMSRDYEHSQDVWYTLYESIRAEGADKLEFLLNLIN